VAVRGRGFQVLLTLLLVDLDAGLDDQLLGVDLGAVDGVPLLGETSQLVQAVLDLLGQELVVGPEPLGVGPVPGGHPVDRAPLLGQIGTPQVAVAVDMGDGQAAFCLQLVGQRGQAGGQAGEGGAAPGPGALGLVLADAHQGQDGQHQQGAQQRDDQFRANWRITKHRRSPWSEGGRRTGSYRLCQYRRNGRICRDLPGQVGSS
jgi:hypothetical protein